MKDIHINYHLFIVLICSLFIIGCKSSSIIIEGNLKDAILKSVNDFDLKYKKTIDKKKVFSVFETENPSYFVVSIIEKERKFLYNPLKKPHENKLPNNYLELGNKLFVWFDDKKQIDEKTIAIYKLYDLLVDDENGNIRFLDDDVLDDKKRSVTYYICKNDLSKFKRRTSNFSSNYKINLKCQ